MLAGLGGYGWSLRFESMRETPTRLRVVATIVAATWILLAVFLITSLAGLFSALSGTASLALIALLGLRGRTAQVTGKLRQDIVAARDALHAIFPWNRRGLAMAAASAPVVIVFGVRWVRAMVMPPTGIDALTYHLFRAGRFVQAGGWVIEPTPDAGGYTAYYPPLGDALWAWIMLPGHSDAMVAMGHVLGMTTLGLCAYAASRELGARRHLAALRRRPRPDREVGGQPAAGAPVWPHHPHDVDGHHGPRGVQAEAHGREGPRLLLLGADAGRRREGHGRCDEGDD